MPSSIKSDETKRVYLDNDNPYGLKPGLYIRQGAKLYDILGNVVHTVSQPDLQGQEDLKETGAPTDVPPPTA